MCIYMILKNQLYFWIDPLRCQIPRNMYTSSSIYIYIRRSTKIQIRYRAVTREQIHQFLLNSFVSAASSGHGSIKRLCV